jgi:hypothetical protein
MDGDEDRNFDNGDELIWLVLSFIQRIGHTEIKESSGTVKTRS